MSSPRVELLKGVSLVGKYVKSRAGPRESAAFLGIPYAKPPVGALRFRPPQPAPLWQGTRDATEFGPICPQNRAVSELVYQPYPVPPIMSEDCLYLNVVTPTPYVEARLPTMVWIHGGAFTTGWSDMYEGSDLVAKQGVICVSINYRCGLFGFMCTGDGEIRGNMGLQDQIEALRWVQTHIHKFGGDPDNVTVFGESAGAISIGLLMTAPPAQGLFGRAIMQSGAAFYPGCVWSPENARKFLMRRLNKIGCTATKGEDMVKYLEGVGWEELVTGPFMDAFPRVLDDNVIPEYPNPKAKPCDLLLGFNSDEGYSFVQLMQPNSQIETVEDARTTIVNTIKMFMRNHPKSAAVVDAALELYVTRRLAADPKTNLGLAVSDIYGDLLFVSGLVRTAQIHSGLAPTYLYEFRHHPAWSPKPEFVDTDHGDELPYVFGWMYNARFPENFPESEEKLSNNVMEYWTNFARTGNPNGGSLPHWPQYTNQHRRQLTLGGDFTVSTNHQQERVDFWNLTVPALLGESASSPVKSKC